MIRASEVPLENATIIQLAKQLLLRVLTNGLTIKAALLSIIALLAYRSTWKIRNLKGKTIVLTGKKVFIATTKKI